MLKFFKIIKILFRAKIIFVKPNQYPIIIYDDVNDVFYPKKPHNGWVLNETTWKWEPPTPKPADENGKSWEWNESTETWDAVLDSNITVPD